MTHFINKTNTPEKDKDCWQTPQALFDAIDREFNFDVDVCASDNNKLCSFFFSAKFSALENEWTNTWLTNCHPTRSFFMNPPYSQTALFLERAAQQAKKHNINVVALVNANTDTKWFADAVKAANEIRLITGRVSFIRADGKKANGNTKGQCVIIWRGNCETPCNITMMNNVEDN